MSGRRKMQCLTLMEERFCQLVALGKTAREAYADAFSVAVVDPRTQQRVDNRASRLMARADVASRIAEAAGEQRRANRRMWSERGEDLAERLYRGILEADAHGELLGKGALKGVEVLARLKGLNAPEETVLKNGGVSEDYTPRGVEGMSEADLRAIIDRDARTADAVDGDAGGADAGSAEERPSADAGAGGGDGP